MTVTVFLAFIIGLTFGHLLGYLGQHNNLTHIERKLEQISLLQTISIPSNMREREETYLTVLAQIEEWNNNNGEPLSHILYNNEMINHMESLIEIDIDQLVEDEEDKSNV